MKVISFYTNHGKYPELAARLKASCNRFDLPHSVVEIPDAGDWTKCNSAKAGFILSKLLDNRGPVLWVDCDCEFRRSPLPEFVGDFACYNWHGDRENVNRFPHEPSKLRSSGGVLYFGYTAPAIEMIIRWVDAVDANPHLREDIVLDEVFNRVKPPVNPLWLGKKWNWMDGLYGPPQDDCVIYHEFTCGAHRDGMEKPE